MGNFSVELRYQLGGDICLPIAQVVLGDRALVSFGHMLASFYVHKIFA